MDRKVEAKSSGALAPASTTPRPRHRRRTGSAATVAPASPDRPTTSASDAAPMDPDRQAGHRRAAPRPRRFVAQVGKQAMARGVAEGSEGMVGGGGDDARRRPGRGRSAPAVTVEGGEHRTGDGVPRRKPTRTCHGGGVEAGPEGPDRPPPGGGRPSGRPITARTRGVAPTRAHRVAAGRRGAASAAPSPGPPTRRGEDGPLEVVVAVPQRLEHLANCVTRAQPRRQRACAGSSRVGAVDKRGSQPGRFDSDHRPGPSRAVPSPAPGGPHVPNRLVLVEAEGPVPRRHHQPAREEETRPTPRCSAGCTTPGCASTGPRAAGGHPHGAG